MSGVKGRSGRKPKASTNIQQYLNSIRDTEIPLILAAMIEKAKAGDKDLMIYLTDRCLGRPRQEIDSRIRAQILVTPDDYNQAVIRAITEEQSLLAEYTETIPQQDIN